MKYLSLLVQGIPIAAVLIYLSYGFLFLLSLLINPTATIAAEERYVDYVDKFTPVFIVSFLLECWAVDRISINSAIRFNDVVTSMLTGVLQQAAHLTFLNQAFILGPYESVLAYSPFIWPDGVLGWLLCFLAIDFAYYWLHRFGHEVNIGWAAHLVHHSSEDMNFSTALRQGALQYTTAPLFYLGLALLGCPTELFMFHLQMNRIYQFFLHTTLIDRLPSWLEWWLNTPSHHRAHHGSNTRYLDKNYGGTLIIFDRLFGTFEPEDTPVVYGLVFKPGEYLDSWNAFVHHAWHWKQMWNLAKVLKGWRKLQVLWKPPGWNPSKTPQHHGVISKQREKWDADFLTLAQKVWVVFKILLFVSVFKRLSSPVVVLSGWEKFSWAVWICTGVGQIGLWADGQNKGVIGVAGEVVWCAIGVKMISLFLSS